MGGGGETIKHLKTYGERRTPFTTIKIGRQMIFKTTPRNIPKIDLDNRKMVY